MTSNHDKPEAGAYTDERVSRSYRDVATETAPGHLDAAVLAQAVAAGRSRYARSRAWTRPVAWAATIVLCVAVVLELTRAPQPDGEMPAPEMGFAAPSPAKPEQAEPAAAPAVQAPVMKTEAPQIKAAAEDARQATPAAASPLDADTFRPRDTDMLQRAKETAELRSGANLEARPQNLTDEAAPTCDAEATATPETWLDCIRDLEKAGLMAQAEKERRLLEAAFPDFDAR